MAVIDYYFWPTSVCLIWKGLYKRLGKERGKVTIKLKKVKWQETPLRLNFLVVKVSGLFQESKVINERMVFYLVALAADMWSVATPCLPQAWVIFTCIQMNPNLDKIQNKAFFSQENVPYMVVVTPFLVTEGQASPCSQRHLGCTMICHIMLKL